MPTVLVGKQNAIFIQYAVCNLSYIFTFQLSIFCVLLCSFIIKWFFKNDYLSSIPVCLSINFLFWSKGVMSFLFGYHSNRKITKNLYQFCIQVIIEITGCFSKVKTSSFCSSGYLLLDTLKRLAMLISLMVIYILKLQMQNALKMT